MPKQPLPAPIGERPGIDELIGAFDDQGRVDETGQLIADMIAQGGEAEVVHVLDRALLREDAGFRMFQIYEAGLRQYRRLAGQPMGGHMLLGVARFLTAHPPTVRAMGQTYDIAARLIRGEALQGEDE